MTKVTGASSIHLGEPFKEGLIGFRLHERSTSFQHGFNVRLHLGYLLIVIFNFGLLVAVMLLNLQEFGS